MIQAAAFTVPVPETRKFSKFRTSSLRVTSESVKLTVTVTGTQAAESLIMIQAAAFTVPVPETQRKLSKFRIS
jgi:hypothetical protein